MIIIVNKTEFNVTFIGCIFKGLYQIINKANHVGFAKFNHHLSLINFPDIHQLIDKAKNSLGVAVHDLVQVEFLGIFFVGYEFFQRTDYKTHRCANFVRYIDEILQFCFIDLLLVFPCQFLVAEFNFVVDINIGYIQHKYTQQDV